MSVTSFIHVNKAENDDFDLGKFSREIEKKYPGTGIELSRTASFSYDICWENYEDTLILSTNTSVEDIEEWLGKLGI